MRQFLLRGALGLTAIILMTTAPQVQAAPTVEALKSGPFLLAQSPEQEKKAKQAAEAARAKEERKQMEMEKSREPMMEKRAPKAVSPPAAAGSKKIGGQTIRDKESPDGD